MGTPTVVHRRDTRANQPAAAVGNAGVLFCVTDEGNIVERSNGTTWEAYSPSAVTTLDASAVTYAPAVDADWSGSTDPGNVDDALDQIADRVTTLESGGGGGLTNFTESANSSSPNATVPVVSLVATNAATNVDVALSPKGTGATLAHIPDSTAAGGNKRGIHAVDWQTVRNNAARVASGTESVISGGDSNTASGTNSTVSGGVGNTASAQRATVGGGNSNNASQTAATISGGDSNAASGLYAAIGGGASNNVSGQAAAVAGGTSNLVSGGNAFAAGSTNRADADMSTAIGHQSTARAVYGAHALASGYFSSQGQAQRREFILRSDTTDGTAEAVTTDKSTAGTTNQVVLPNTSLFAFHGYLVVRENATGDSKAVEFKGAIKRGANAASTALVGSVTQADLGADAGAATWTVAFTADTTNGALKIEVTGEASHTLRWVARVVTVEVEG